MTKFPDYRFAWGLLLGLAVGGAFALSNREWWVDKVEEIGAIVLLAILIVAVLGVILRLSWPSISKRLLGSAQGRLEYVMNHAVDAASQAAEGRNGAAVQSFGSAIKELIAWNAKVRFMQWSIASTVALLAAYAAYAGVILLIEQNELLQTQNSKIEQQLSINLQVANSTASLESAAASYSEISSVLLDDDSTTHEITLALRRLPDVAAMSVQIPTRSLTTDSEADTETDGLRFSLPNAERLRTLLQFFMRIPRGDRLTEGVDAGAHEKFFTALSYSRAVSSEILIALHRLGPNGSSSNSLWATAQSDSFSSSDLPTPRGHPGPEFRALEKAWESHENDIDSRPDSPVAIDLRHLEGNQLSGIQIPFAFSDKEYFQYRANEVGYNTFTPHWEWLLERRDSGFPFVMHVSQINFTLRFPDEVDLTGADLRGVLFNEASLTKARLGDSRIDYSIFIKTNFAGAKFTELEGFLSAFLECEFTDSDWNNCTFDAFHFENCRFSGPAPDESRVWLYKTSIERSFFDELPFEGTEERQAFFVDRFVIEMGSSIWSPLPVQQPLDPSANYFEESVDPVSEDKSYQFYGHPLPEY